MPLQLGWQTVRAIKPLSTPTLGAVPGQNPTILPTPSSSTCFTNFYDLVTYRKARQFFKLHSGSPVHILLWLMSVVNQATILITSGVSDPMNVNKVLKGQYSAIPSEKFYEAIDLVNDTTDKFNKIISGMDSTPTCLLVTNYENDQAQKASAKTEKKAPPDHASAPAPIIKNPASLVVRVTSSSGPRTEKCPTHLRPTRPNVSV